MHQQGKTETPLQVNVRWGGSMGDGCVSCDYARSTSKASWARSRIQKFKEKKRRRPEKQAIVVSRHAPLCMSMHQKEKIERQIFFYFVVLAKLSACLSFLLFWRGAGAQPAKHLKKEEGKKCGSENRYRRNKENNWIKKQKWSKQTKRHKRNYKGKVKTVNCTTLFHHQPRFSI